MSRLLLTYGVVWKDTSGAALRVLPCTSPRERIGPALGSLLPWPLDLGSEFCEGV